MRVGAGRLYRDADVLLASLIAWRGVRFSVNPLEASPRFGVEVGQTDSPMNWEHDPRSTGRCLKLRDGITPARYESQLLP